MGPEQWELRSERKARKSEPKRRARSLSRVSFLRVIALNCFGGTQSNNISWNNVIYQRNCSAHIDTSRKALKILCIIIINTFIDCYTRIIRWFGQGGSELGELKVKKYFETFPMFFQAKFQTSRISRRYISTESERLYGFRRAIAHWKRIIKG